MNEQGRDYFEKAVRIEVGSSPHPCPVCGLTTFSEGGSYEICEHCNWEDDPVQAADLTLAGGANTQSLEQARTAWNEKVK